MGSIRLTNNELRWLVITNLMAAILHTGICTTVAIVGDLGLQPPLYGVDIAYANGSGVGVPTITTFGTFPITRIVVAYPAVTAFFHFGNALIWPKFYFDMLERCQNPMRWAEYTVTASLMTTVISFLTGVRTTLLLTALAILVASTILCGYSTEQVNRPTTPLLWNNPSYLSRVRNTLLGFLPYSAEWSITIVTLLTLTNCRNAYIIAILASEFALWCIFPLIQLIQFYRPPKDFVYGEFAFIFMSLTAKAVLAIVALAAGYLSKGAEFCKP